MFKSRLVTAVLGSALLTCPAHAVQLSGDAIQGGLIFGQAESGSSVTLDDREVMVSDDGRFVIGFGRDDTGSVTAGTGNRAS
jgi:hypothetical protein